MGDSDPDSVSQGSSTSTRLNDEYENLLKYALVTPNSLYPNRANTKTLESRDADKVTGTSWSRYEFGTHDGYSKVISSRNAQSHAYMLDEAPSSEANIKISDDELAGFGNTQTTEGESQQEDYIRNKVFGSTNYVHHGDPTKETLDSLDHLDKSDSEEADRTPINPEDAEDDVQDPFHDPDVIQFEVKMKDWTSTLQQNILAEVCHMKMKMLQDMRDLQAEKNAEYERRIHQMTRQNDELRELLANYERNLDQKDVVINNLTTSIRKQKNKEGVMRSFFGWKLRHSDEKREDFCSQVALDFFHRRLLQRAFRAWRGVKENKWMERVERACQNRAQEVCEDLTRNYEEQLGEMDAKLQRANSVIDALKSDRETFEERMKKGFMRGVCALNLEAMTMFKEREEEGVKENLQPIPVYAPVTKSLPVRSEHPIPKTTTIPCQSNNKSPRVPKSGWNKGTKPVHVRLMGTGSEPNITSPPQTVVIERHTEEATPHRLPSFKPKSKVHQNLAIKIVK